MIDDPVVEEIHKTRERILKAYGGSEALLQDLREIEIEFKDRVVRLEPRRPLAPARKVS